MGTHPIFESDFDCLTELNFSRMPDQKRLAYPENSENYKLFSVEDKTAEKEVSKDDQILLQTNIISNANGSAYVEYNKAKVIVTCIGPKDISRREDFSQEGCLKVDMNYCAFAKRGGRQMPGKTSNNQKEQAAIIQEAMSSVIYLQRYPKSQIDLCCQVLEEGSSESVTLAATVTACGLAAADAGLEMFGLVVGAGSESTFVSYMPELNQITGLVSINIPETDM